MDSQAVVNCQNTEKAHHNQPTNNFLCSSSQVSSQNLEKKGHCVTKLNGCKLLQQSQKGTEDDHRLLSPVISSFLNTLYTQTYMTRFSEVGGRGSDKSLHGASLTNHLLDIFQSHQFYASMLAKTRIKDISHVTSLLIQGSTNLGSRQTFSKYLQEKFLFGYSSFEIIQ